MPSPFPGMDPYLEQFWGDVHTSIALYARDQLQSRLPNDLVARVEETLTVDTGEDRARVHFFPDVRITEHAARVPRPARHSLPIVVSTPVVVPIDREPKIQRSVRILTVPELQVITVIEILSRSNKSGKAGRTAYRKKRRTLLRAGASIVELDLIRSGRSNLAVPADLLPEGFRKSYLACVVRAWRPGRPELHRFPLQNPLPAIPIPLRKSDKDVLLELQPLIRSAYEGGCYETIPYDREAYPPLDPADAAWADALLRKAGLRGAKNVRAKKKK